MNKFITWANSFLVEEDDSAIVPKLLACDKLSFTNFDDTNLNLVKKIPSALYLPFAVNDAFTAVAKLEDQRTRPDGSKIFCVSISAPELQLVCFEPGDTIGILPENKPEDVEWILKQTECTNPDQPIKLMNSDTKRKYLPAVSTHRELFKKYVSLNSIPTKQTIAKLAEFAVDQLDRRKMRFLASAQGAEAYSSVILESNTGFLQLVKIFSSCRPPSAVLLQLLPRLLPRPYSIASSRLTTTMRLSVALSVLPPEKEGVCTGMLRRAFQDSTEAVITTYFRKPSGFRIQNETSPLILVGPGTGVAPYIGFLDQIHLEKTPRTVYLFTGFRSEEDYIFKDELEKHLEGGTLTKLLVCYSRQEGTRLKYVQDAIRANATDVARLIIEENAQIYECGDFKKMTSSVSEAFAAALSNNLGCSGEEATAKVKEMKVKKRYLQDLWT